ncbi:SLBB domain-containing protein [Natronogracilivirga saccharolytica]|uniref:SLBB domain-containing protein n=1 Tax=Natronogracilivirga saccharolytica TaxID=2812953 RepID=A0A8J7UY03_9BACT|nr:SLBB domain-containing protein [Natronogracilivirga saccharolytica]MBP3193914.1 SLBB domain-containing protein [Natronogracilivirga saccharolytica]
MLYQHSLVPLTALSLLFVLIIGLLPSGLEAQDNERRRSMQIQMSPEIESNLFFDELGLEMTLARFHETYLDIDTYELGPGDLLGLTLKGNVSGIFRGMRVNSHGAILIPRVGSVKVDGLLFDEARELIESKVQEELPGTSISLTLEHPRNLKVNVVGNVPFTGPQIVLAQTRVDQAVYHSFFEPVADDLEDEIMLANKYPQEFIESNQYAIRNIVINRKDGSQVTADLYRYLKTGDESANPVVKEGDIINIQELHDHNPRVSVSGGVNQDLELEYRSDDTIDRLIKMAGGPTYDAAEDYIRVSRVTEEGARDIVLDDSASIAGFDLQPNDRVIIPYDRDKRRTENVQVFGEANYTGRFSIKDGETTLYELMEKTGGLTSMALPQAAYLMRTQPGRTEYGIRHAFDPRALTRTSDQVMQGFEYLDLEAQLIRNRVYIDLTDEDQLKDVTLYHGDRLHIPKNEGTVFVFGQVNQPGYYNFDEDKSSSDFISKAGGFALSAEEDRVFVIKAQTNSWHRPDDTIIEPGDLIFVDREPFDELQAARTYDMQKRAQRNSNIQLVMTGLTTITSIITAYIAVTR